MNVSALAALYAGTVALLTVVGVPTPWFFRHHKERNFDASHLGLRAADKIAPNWSIDSPLRDEVFRGVETLTGYPKATRTLLALPEATVDEFLVAYVTAAANEYTEASRDDIAAKLVHGRDLAELTAYLKACRSLVSVSAALRDGISLEYAAVAFAR